MISAKKFLIISFILFLCSLSLPFYLMKQDSDQIARVAQPCTATIIDSRVAFDFSPPSASADGTSNTTSYWVPVFILEYVVDGRMFNYEYRPYYHEKKCEDQSYAEQYLREHPVGSQIKIFYNPDNPSEARADRKLSTFPFYLMGFLFIGLIFANFGRWANARNDCL